MTAPTGLSDVLARIQQIQAQLATTGPTAAPATGTDFATVLGAQADPTATGPAAATAGVPVATASLGANPGTAAPGTDLGAAAAQGASRYLGVPYQWGGTDPSTGLDCSGLVQRVYGDLGVALPRTSQEQAGAGTPVAGLADAQPGDLVFFAGSDGTPNAPGHVGIYLGGGQMIDAPYTGASVRIDPVGTPVAIRRIDGGSGSPAGATPVGGLATGRPADLSISSYTGDFVAAGNAHGVPAALLAAVAKTESGLDPTATSPAGAEGLMQLMPSTAASLGVDPWDPSQAIDGAARLLAADRARFGSWPLAVAAYNAGAGAVASYGGIPPYPETQAYVTKVLSSAGMS